MNSILGKSFFIFLLFAIANTLALGFVFAHFSGVNAEQGRSRAIRDLLSHSDTLVDQWLREELRLGQVLARTTYPSAALEFNLERQFIDFVKDLQKNDNGVSFALYDKDGRSVGGRTSASNAVAIKQLTAVTAESSQLFCNRDSLTQIFSVGDSQGALGYLTATVAGQKLTKAFGDRLSIMLKDLGSQAVGAHVSFNCAFDHLVPFETSFIRFDTSAINLDWQAFPSASRVLLLSCLVSAILASLGFVGLFFIFNGSFKALMRVACFVSLPGTEAYTGRLPRDSFFEGLARQLLDGQRQRVGGLELMKEKQANAAKLKLAAQVAHDIRSPLAALDMVVSDLGVLAEEKRLLVRSAVGRIRDIANELLLKNRPAVEEANVSHHEELELLSTQLIPAVVDELITEKRTQYRSNLGAEIHFDAGAETYGIFAKVRPIELKRVLSNLINNSIEALDGAGQVVVSLNSLGDKVQLIVRDSGRGIQSDILAKLGRLGLTHGKQGGSGIGLHHACRSVEAWGGRLAITSEVGVGTVVTVTLPRADPPAWFVPQLVIMPKSTVVVLDDDSSIHQIWQERFESPALVNANVTVLHFSLPSEIREWSAQVGSARAGVMCLLDYELVGEDTNGLALAEELGLSSALLVTSRYEDEAIRESCHLLGIRLIPKGMAGFVPLRVCASQVDVAGRDLPKSPVASHPAATAQNAALSPVLSN